MKKLTKIRLINWHYISNETIDVKNNILLTGPNASGKSTIMDAITFIITAGETTFNLAANEKGKRDLKGYVKCKLGMDDKEYLRDGDVSSHIALEFYDEKEDKNFTVGAVIDAFGDLTPVKVVFYIADNKINDSMFVSDNGIIYSTVEFRKHNPNSEYFLTKKEAKRGFRNAFGSINEDFFKLIPKALAFKPISDVKDFIYQNILEEKEIDVSSIKDSIRSYKELENTLKLIKSKINSLQIMDSIYQEIIATEDKKNYYHYLVQLFEIENLIDEVKQYQVKIKNNQEKSFIKQSDIKAIDREIDALNERSKEIYIALSNNEEFKAEEYIDKSILKANSEISELEVRQNDFLRRVSWLKDQINELRKTSDNKIYTEIANMPLVKISEFDCESTKAKLNDLDYRISDLVATNNQEVGRLESQKNDLIKDINEISTTLRSLDQNKINYNPTLLALRSEIAQGLKRIYNYDVSVHIYAELLEITDQKWADTIEIFLGNRRFNLIVEPKYFDEALQIYSRIKNNYRLYGIGLINTKEISKFTKFENKSLASIITSENKDAVCYTNYSCGNVIMCDNVMDLEKYNTSITNDGLIYRGYTVSNLNPNIEKPFIGKNALSSQTEQWNQKALEKKTEYLELNEEINKLKKELEVLNKIDIKIISKDLDASLLLQKEQNVLKDLINKKERQKNMTVSDLEDEYHKILQTIKNYDAKKISISQEIGAIANEIETLEVLISKANETIEGSKKALKELSKDDYALEQKAKVEYNDIKANMKLSVAMNSYEKMFDEIEKTYTSLSDSLIAKQFSYTNEFNSTYSIGVSEMDKYLAELNKLEKSELIKYEQKVRSAREEAEIIFKEDFLSKLRNNIMTAENEIKKINDTLSNIQFGRDRYEFIFPKSSDYSTLYEMVTSDLSVSQTGIMTYDFQAKYEQQLEELFDSLAIDELNSNGAINKFTDYRTYMDYDIKITNEFGDSMSYSKVFKEKSGGETQVPFYVAIIASFVRVYTKTNNLGGDPIGIVMFDEVFDKMDTNRMKAMMAFICSMPLQVIIACPPQRMSLLSDFTDTTLVMVRQGSKAQVLPMIRNVLEEVEIEDEEGKDEDDGSFY